MRRSPRLALLVLGVAGAVSVAGLPHLLDAGRTTDTSQVAAQTAAAPLAQAAARTRELPPTVQNVTLTPDAQNPRVVMLAFDSELLKLRAVTRVLLPTGYVEAGAPYGVLYQLHGTRGNTALVDAVTNEAPTLSLGAADTAVPAAEEQFLVVQLDAGPIGWCNSCWWVDGRDGQGVLAESHLLREVLPVVEAMFNVRSDRAGRAVYGTSMGGIGALIQAFRHPDVFGYVASQSGPPSGAEHEDAVQLHQDGLYYGTYLVTQGYPDPVTNPAAYRNIDVVTLAPQVVGTGLRILLGANDGCLPPFDPEPQPVGDPACMGSPDPNQAFHMANEYGIRIDNEALAARLLDLGVPFRLETEHGRHGIGTLYREHVVPELNAAFRESLAPPEAFSYKTTERAFSVWGYDVAVERDNEEFVYLAGVQADGSELTVAGTGSATILTAPNHALRGRQVDVTLIRENAPPELLTATADDEGRVRVELVLGPARSAEERRLVTRQGLWPSPRTRVLIRPRPGAVAPVFGEA